MFRNKTINEKIRKVQLWQVHVDEEMGAAFAHFTLADFGLIAGLAILAIGLPETALFVLNWG